MNKRFYFFVAFLFAHLFAFAQTNILGRVLAEDGMPISYANVTLLSHEDSTYIAGTISGEGGEFHLQSAERGIIKVSCIGFKAVYLSDFEKNPLEVVLRYQHTTLKEAVVKSTLPVTRMENHALVTRIKGTVLENIGTAKDVLGRLPGIMVEQDAVSVFGKGTPAIYINGQLVRNNNMLNQLQSTKIKQVELITNPGAKYDATVSSVIRITAERSPGEGFSFDNRTKIGVQDYIYLSEQVDMNYRYNNLDIFTLLEYKNGKTEGRSANIQNSWLTQHFMQDLSIKSVGRQSLYEGKIGFNYSLSPNHSFGAYYQASRKPLRTKSHYNSQSWIDEWLDEISSVDKNAEAKTTERLIDGYYTGTFGKWSLDIILDALWTKGVDNEFSAETFHDSNLRTVTVFDDTFGRMLAGEMHFSHPLWKGSFDFGLEHSSTRRHEKSMNPEAIIANYDDESREDNTGVYAEFSQRLGRCNLRLGMRYEHIDSRFYEWGVKQKDMSRSYDNLFPTASLMLPVGKSILQLSYSKKYNRPLYSQLSSAISYVNRYLYQSGNPLLQSQFEDNISFVFRHSWLILMANYTHTDGKIIDECSQYGDDASIMLLRKENSSPSLHRIQVMAALSPHFGIYYPSLMVGCLAQNYKINYLWLDKKFFKPMFIIRWNNLFHFQRGYVMNFDFNWRSSGDAENIRLGSNWSLNAGVNKQFGKHWNVKVAINDIFNSSKKNRSILYSGVSDLQTTKFMTSRSIECAIRYNFNTTKSKYKGQGAGNQERIRLQND